MKCGIITIHSVPNYGAIFQAFGLLEYINEQTKNDAEIIDYHMNPSVIVDSQPNNAKKYWNYLHKLIHLKKYIKSKKRDKYFDLFRKKYYKLSEKTFFGDYEIEVAPPIYDVYISGSDQIFNLDLTNGSFAYYLKYFEGKKISYSTSFGMEGINHSFENQIIDMLSNYSAVSVREMTAKVFLQSRGINAKTTVDPVFLLDENKWKTIQNKVKIPSKYVFCFLMSDNDNIIKTIDWIEKQVDIPIVVLHTYNGKMRFKCKYCDYCAPGDFLFLINNAEYVVTNSFHGSAFSIIFKRKLFILEEEKYQSDQRYEAMLTESGMLGKIIPFNTDWGNFKFEDYLIDGKSAYQKMEKWIDESKRFLIQQLGE